jgi:hypothetical protein
LRNTVLNKQRSEYQEVEHRCFQRDSRHKAARPPNNEESKTEGEKTERPGFLHPLEFSSLE